MFSNLTSSPLFLLVVISTGLLTVFFVQYAGDMMRLSPLTSVEHSACILWGATPLLIATILKLTPAHLVEKLPIFIDENKAIDPNDPMMAAYLAQANAKAINKSGGVAP